MAPPFSCPASMKNDIRSDAARRAELARRRREAATAMRAGIGEEAIAAHRLLLELDPAQPDAWFNLAYLLRHLGRPEEALDAYAAALDHGVARPEEARLNRAAILSDHLLDPDAAMTELELALRANPRFGLAWFNIGALHEDRGDEAAAVSAYRALLALVPDDARALGRLAELARTEEDRRAALAELDGRLALPDVGDDDKAELLFARARTLDRLARYDDAFISAQGGNAIAGELAARAGWRYDAVARGALVDRIAAAPTAVGDADGGPAPLFICGMFRSGSTVLEHVLGAHPALCAGGEIDALPRLVAERLPRYPDELATLDAGELAAMRAFYRAQAGRAACGDRIVIDKRPDNFLYLGLAKHLFPAARVLITRRHPLDVILSNLFLRFHDSVSYSFGLESAAHWLVQERRLARHWLRSYPDSVAEVDYDRLVITPRAVIGEALAFLRLEWDDACLSFHERRAAIRTPSGWQARQPLHAGSSGRWRRYRDRLAPAVAILRAGGVEVEGWV